MCEHASAFASRCACACCFYLSKKEFELIKMSSWHPVHLALAGACSCRCIVSLHTTSYHLATQAVLGCSAPPASIRYTCRSCVITWGLFLASYFPDQRIEQGKHGAWDAAQLSRR